MIQTGDVLLPSNHLLWVMVIQYSEYGLVLKYFRMVSFAFQNVLCDYRLGLPGIRISCGLQKPRVDSIWIGVPD
ncbi:hypothetical protein Avbf_15899 [Armadillidium vulgare]|nr:hypothetical protein Avbf_15899 [Armadillidium vulgare]